ncbi:hypothetical protein QMK33_06855 [Hymenobacter sp. H14-R3]|uniref:hypothetical protein n=1 Tax=Hymenobacter sp. H14-R3 TaxID=3046308 RepID=UPI0024BB9492|nr:hypothetical protein [Hymenobacter sp. H14-R3]MDJ0364867.1 hypothetical protein [Hymenobacter sp. H14-R3]
MSTISKKLVGFLYGGAAQTLTSAAWKGNVNAVYGFNSGGTGYQVFKPGNTFNSLTQLVPDGMYILDADKLGFDLPGAVLTASTATGPAAGALALNSFIHSFSGGYDNITIQVSSPVATDTEYLLVFDSPGAYSYKLALNDSISLSVPNVAAGQVVTLSAVAPSGARLTHTFTVGEQAAAAL